MAHYVKGKELLAEAIKCKETGVMSDKLGGYFMQMVHRYASKPNFATYTYREDFESEALVTLCKNWQKFDPERTTNAFAYYTSVIHNAFIQILNKEKKQREIRDAVLTDQGHQASWSYQESQGTKVSTDSPD